MWWKKLSRRPDLRVVGLRVAVSLSILAFNHPAASLAFLQQHGAGPQVNKGSQAIQEFKDQVAEYVKFRKSLESELPKLRSSSDSPQEIDANQRMMARKIAEARRNAKEGEFFTPAARAEFVSLLRSSMQSREAPRIRESLNNAEPLKMKLVVNQPYPDGIPLQSMPPSLLLNLPPLPHDMLEYRLTGRDLVLRDVKANLVLDVIRGAVP